MNPESLSVHLPVSLVADFSSLREKTLKVGQVGRALAIFRVGDVFIYNDDDSNVKDSKEEANIIGTLLRYMDTPQYLRKTLFPYMEELQFAGLLPPLRTPHHPLQDERNEKGDFREAAVIESTDGESHLDLGLPEEGVFEGELEKGSRVTVRIGAKLGEDKRLVHIVDEEDIEEYWGFRVSRSEGLAQSLSKAESDYIIGTSRRGQNLYEAVKGIKANNTDDLTVAFGGPYQGLFEICEKQGVNSEDQFDVMVNTVPQQGTKTVRSEEALVATLAELNLLLGKE